jgi:hypothetical protein
MRMGPTSVTEPPELQSFARRAGLRSGSTPTIRSPTVQDEALADDFCWALRTVRRETVAGFMPNRYDPSKPGCREAFWRAVSTAAT